MRMLLRKIILWALAAVEPPNLDPSDLDKKAADAK